LGLRGRKVRGDRYSEGLREWYCSPNVFFSCDTTEKNKMGGACSTYGERRDAYRDLVKKPEGKRPLGRPRRRGKYNIEMDLQEVGWGMDWIELAQNRNRWRAVLNVVMNLGFYKPLGVS